MSKNSYIIQIVTTINILYTLKKYNVSQIMMIGHRLVLSYGFVLIVLCSACSQEHEPPQESISVPVSKALKIIGLNQEALSVPKLGRPYSMPGRLPIVDDMMKSPLKLINLSQQLTLVEIGGLMSTYVSRLLTLLKVGDNIKGHEVHVAQTGDDVWKELLSVSMKDERIVDKPDDLRKTGDLYEVIRSLLLALADARQAYHKAGGQVTSDELKAIKNHLAVVISSEKPIPEERRLSMDEYHQIGVRVDIKKLSEILVTLLASVEKILPTLYTETTIDSSIDWDTPLGRVRVTGAGNDRHSGDFLLLIDLGGNDVYEDVGRSLEPGAVSIVIDMSGNDVVKWKSTPGPGAGVMGVSLWVDLEGDDIYTGRNVGAGSGILGAGILWDASGDDIYKGGSLVQGAGQYGIGLLIDGDGVDNYSAEMSSQGYGGTGGVGIQLDFNGNDSYFCGGLVPDQVQIRNKRHDDVHYLSMCQGYSFGRRPEISGGIGLLLDENGDDIYKVDIFGQGASLWFGLGMLVDKEGNDKYKCFEHCQGESLHLGVGFLGDWGGDDTYDGYEHSQGVGVDRAAGILYDKSGNDIYRSSHESQGAGIKPYGVGILIDESGDDYYEAIRMSQGYSARPPEGFPDHQWPVGVFLDQDGADNFVLPGVIDADSAGRIQNRQGIALDK